MRYDVFADFHLGRFCDFDCSYCYCQGPEKKDPSRRGAPKERIVAGFDGTGRTWFVHITGGEPFLHPQFVDLCEELTRRHYIGVNTNLSAASVREFAERVPPERVGYVHASYHVEVRRSDEAMKGFVGHVRLLRSKGFLVHATQVIYPAVVPVFPELFERLAREGVFLRPKVMKGLYRWRSYPSGYTRGERELILRYIERCREEPVERDFFDRFFFKEDEFVAGDLSFKGRSCRAGAAFVVIRSNGDVVRCLDVRDGLGNLFDGSLKLRAEGGPCPAARCSSARFGLNFCEGQPEITRTHPLRAVAAQLVKNARIGIRRARARR